MRCMLELLSGETPHHLFGPTQRLSCLILLSMFQQCRGCRATLLQPRSRYIQSMSYFSSKPPSAHSILTHPQQNRCICILTYAPLIITAMADLTQSHRLQPGRGCKRPTSQRLHTVEQASQRIRFSRSKNRFCASTHQLNRFACAVQLEQGL